MTDTDTKVMQERIGELCHQFKMPTMGAQSVAPRPPRRLVEYPEVV